MCWLSCSEPSRRIPNHAGIYVYVDGVKVTTDTLELSPEVLYVQKQLASICRDIVKF